MSYGNGIKLTAGFDVGAKTPLDSKSVVQTIAERDAFVTDNLVYEGLEVYVKDTGHKYRYNGTSWIDLDTQYGSESGTGEGLTTEQINQLTSAYEHSQTPHVSADDVPTNTSDLTNDSGFITSSDLPTVPTKVSDLENDSNFVTNSKMLEAIANAQLGNGEDSDIDLSAYQPIEESTLTTTAKTIPTAINELKSGLDGITVPTKTSDLTNDSNFITSIPEEYITETELEAKGYLTEHQSLTDYAKKTDIPDVSDFLTEVPEGYVTDTKLSTELDKKVNKEVGKGLSTNDLTNELVTKINSSATEAFVTNAIANAQLGGKEVDLSGYATVDALNLKADLTHTHDQYLTKVPDEYITETELNAKGYLTEHQDISNLALKSEIPDVSSFITSDDLPTVPTKVSDLANDKNYISSIPSEYVTETELNAKGYLTSHQDISNLQPKTDNSLTTTDKTVIGAINELKTNISNINTGGGSSFSGSYNDLTDKPTIPTKTSDLNNDSGFIDNTDIIIVNKGDNITEVNIDNDIPSGSSTILLTGRIVSDLYDKQLVTVNKSGTAMTVWDTKGSKVVFNKSNGSWARSSSATHIYNNDASVIYQKINDNTLTTTAKTIPTAINELKSGLDGIKVPINISELNNDSGFITSIPEEYITETELNAKGYLTSHQDISGLQPKTDNSLTTTDKTVIGAINEISGTQLDTVSFSADYKNIILNRKSGLNPYTIPIASIINNTSLTELKDIDGTDIGNGKTIVYNSVTQKHKYVNATLTDELVKMDSTTDAHYLADLIDKSTIVNEDGILKVKMLDGQDVTIAEINNLKGLTMNIMDLVNSFTNGWVKVLNTPVATYADLITLDRSAFVEGISYIVYVLEDETHTGAKTTYLCDKTSSTYFGNADSQRNFTTNPIDLANEVTGKLDNSHIDVDSLWTLLTINDTYKTLTTKNEVFGTHGAKAMYDELLTEIGAKANATDLTTHTNNTDIHVTTTDKAKWDKVIDKVDTVNFNTHKDNTDIHITNAERTKWDKVIDKVDTVNFNTHKDNTDIHITNAERTKWDKVDKKVDKTDIVDNLTSTDTNKLLSAKQGKILNDTKLNKTDANKLNCVTIDNVSLKEYILTNCTETGKTYYLIAKTTCTDLPKASNFYITVETPGTYTYKVTAKELNDSNGIYVCTYRTISSTWTKWEKVCTTTVADIPVTYINTFENETYVKPASTNVCSYYVSNGNCIISIETICLSTSTDFTQIISGLPKPKTTLYANAIDRTMSIKSGARGLFQLTREGVLNIACDYGDTSVVTTRYLYISFSYPVAEP